MAVNTLLTADVVVKAAAAMYNANTPFLQSIDRQYDKSYGIAGAEEGDTIRIQTPIRATTRTGKIAKVQAREENKVDLVKASMIGVDMKFSSAELAQDIEPFTKNTLMPYIDTLTSTIEYNVGQSAYKGVHQSVGTAGTDPATFLTYGQAKAKLDNMNAARMDRAVWLNPNGESATVDGLKALQNPSQTLDKNFITGTIGKTSDFLFSASPNVPTHTTGGFAGSVVVNEPSGVSDGDATIDLDAFTDTVATVKEGDIFTIAGVEACNPLTGQSTGQLQQFRVTADKSGVGSNEIDGIGVYPAFKTTGAYKTVTALPADGAAVTFIGSASSSYAQNLAYQRRAFTYATVDLPLYGNTNFESKFELNGTNMRLQKVVDGGNDDIYYRLDVLYGFAVVVPEWATRIQGA